MSRRLYPLLYAGLAIAAVVWLVGRIGSPQGKIHRQLEQLAEVLAKDGPESAVEQAAKGHRLSGFFATGFTLDLGPYGQVDRVGEVARMAAGYRNRHDRIAVSFSDLETSITGQVATTLAMVRVASGALGSGGRESYRLRLQWRQEGGDWRIVRLELLE